MNETLIDLFGRRREAPAPRKTRLQAARVVDVKAAPVDEDKRPGKPCGACGCDDWRQRSGRGAYGWVCPVCHPGRE